MTTVALPRTGRLLPPVGVKLLIALAIGFLLYALAGFVVVPWLVKRQVTQRFQSILGRQAAVASVKFNPFTLESRLIGFDLRDRDGSPLLAFDTLVINASSRSALNRSVALDEFRLVHPVGVVRIESSGRLALADMLADSAKAATTPDTIGTSPPRVEVDRLAVVDGAIDFVDESRSPTYREEFRDLSLEVEELSTLPNEEGNHVLTVKVASGALVEWTGVNVLEPLDLSGKLAISGARLAKLGGILGNRAPLQITQGRLGGTMEYRVTQAPGKGLVVNLPNSGWTLDDVAARPAGSEGDWVRVGKAQLTGTTIEWPGRVARIDRVQVVDPWVIASMEKDGTLNWTPVIDRMTTEHDTAEVKPADEAPWDVKVGTLEVTGGSATITDNSVRPAARYNISGASLSVSPVTSDSTTQMDVAASATLDPKTTVSVKGTAVRSPLTADLDVALKSMDLRRTKPYLAPNALASLSSGVLAVNGKAKIRAGRPRLTFDGGGSLGGFAVLDTAGDSLLAWKDMKLKGIRYTQQPDRMRIGQVTLEEPFARIAISRERTINLMSLTTMLPPRDTTQPAFPYEILEVAINNGRIDFSDESLILPFRTDIDSTHGTIRDVASFGGAPGALEIEGKVEEYGLARAKGSLHVDDPFLATNIDAEFRNLDMKSFTPYSAQFAGYSIADGRLDMDMHYVVKDRQLNATHHIVAKDLKLGDKVEGGESPGFLVKLAISLLKDKDGRITLDVPVEGTVDDPEFSYKGIVWKAMKSILGKIATAPFRFLGKLLGIGGDDAELVDFDPGRTDVIPPEQEKLDSLAAEMTRKPELQLIVEGRYDSISDAAAIRENKLEAQMRASRDSLGKKAQNDTSASMSAKLLETLYVQAHGKQGLDSLEDSFKAAARADTAKRKYNPAIFYAAIRDSLLAVQTVEPGALEQLGKDRSAAVIAAMTTAGIDPARMTAAEPEPVKKKKEGSSRVPSELKLDAK